MINDTILPTGKVILLKVQYPVYISYYYASFCYTCFSVDPLCAFTILAIPLFSTRDMKHAHFEYHPFEGHTADIQAHSLFQHIY